jgi:hypothetical protein
MEVAGLDDRFVAMVPGTSALLKETPAGASQQHKDAKQLFHSILDSREPTVNTGAVKQTVGHERGKTPPS